MGAWHDEEKQLALIYSVQKRDLRVIPVLLPGARSRDVEGFLRMNTWVDLAEPDGFARLVAGITGQAPELVASLEPGPDVGWRIGVMPVCTLLQCRKVRPLIKQQIIDTTDDKL
jgi:hypothetical protein